MREVYSNSKSLAITITRLRNSDTKGRSKNSFQFMTHLLYIFVHIAFKINKFP